jgi:hypothetical protein
LHFEAYRSCFADNQAKELPRVPSVNSTLDFREFSKAERDLSSAAWVGCFSRLF